MFFGSTAYNEKSPIAYSRRFLFQRQHHLRTSSGRNLVRSHLHIEHYWLGILCCMVGVILSANNYEFPTQKCSRFEFRFYITECGRIHVVCHFQHRIVFQWIHSGLWDSVSQLANGLIEIGSLFNLYVGRILSAQSKRFESGSAEWRFLRGPCIFRHHFHNWPVFDLWS